MKRFNPCNFDDLLVELDIEAGDKVFMHAFVPSLGMIEGGLRSVSDVIIRRIGPKGTLIVPTFTASYRRNEIYDVNESKSFNGALSEHVRKLPGAVRSLCPLFSMAAIGADAERLMTRPSPCCFGQGSVYQMLFDADVKFLGLGIDWDQGLSFFMHLERMADIPYRREETFFGCTRLADGRLIDDKAVHYVRIETPKWHRDRGRISKALMSRGVLREAIREGTVHRMFYARRLADATLELLRADPWCMTDRAKEAA